MKKSYLMDSAVISCTIEVIASYHGAFSVACADGVLYTPSEVRKLEACGLEVSKTMHVLKKMFQGELVQIRALTPQEKWVQNKYGGGNHEK